MSHTELTFDLIEDAIELAETWQERANQAVTAEERTIQAQLARLMTRPRDKVRLARMIDHSFRAADPGRVADQVRYLLRTDGVPRFMSTLEKLLTGLFLGVGRHVPAVSVPRMIAKIRQDSSRVIVPGEEAPLQAFLRRRRSQGVRVNVNHLGEAVLGEDEAEQRLQTYIADLEDPAIEYISVKISTIYSQINPLAFAHTVDQLKTRLSRLYRAAGANLFVRADGTRGPKFVNLDMEEYRDLEITRAAFVQTLDQAEFKDHSAGIVLQAYLPDSYALQQELTDWARRRVAAGGAPVKIRVVKGANLEMERLEASLFNWPLAPYDNKQDVDANYKRMLLYGMQPENIRAVRLGVASHNMFDLALAWRLARENRVARFFDFEMIEGMANHVRRVLSAAHDSVLVYAPVANRSEFINAIAYLIRRLDENTGVENFLRHAPSLRPHSDAWDFLKQQFIDACRHTKRVASAPRRTQDRRQESWTRDMGTYHTHQFVNEPDTDWSLAANRRWAADIREKWQGGGAQAPVDIPVVVAGEIRTAARAVRESLDPNQLPTPVLVARHRSATAEDLQRAVATAAADPDGWRAKSARERHQVLSRVALALRRARADLIGAAAADTGKVFTEADVEISEAIDFAEFYPFSVAAFDDLPTLHARGRGVGLVASPWNFPIAIPCGGVLAALAAGNTVIFKPASDAVLVAWLLCQCFWEAGISRNTLQFLPGEGALAGRELIGHPDIDFVILTGGTDTGLAMLRQAPGIFLAAETGGKNATIVTAMADRDQAIKNIVYSAFGHGGQKCSATSLLILEREVYADAHFKAQLVDAARSLAVGSAWAFRHRLGPLIRPPAGHLERALTRLEPGESWALQPENLAANAHLWTPGIKWDVQPNSLTHTTEFFGPLLGVMQADDLEHAVELVNATGYGLTAGIESLDEREQDYFKAHLQAGNLYVNRGTTGAITLRQPFGGMGKSALGPGLKAGSPDYVAQFMDFEETSPPPIGPLQGEHRLLRLVEDWRRRVLWGGFGGHRDDLMRVERAVKSYLYRMETWFGREMDFFHLRGQDNIFRYRPLGKVMVRVHAADTLFEVLARVAAAGIAGNGVQLSLPPDLAEPVVDFLESHDGRSFLGQTAVERQDDKALIDALSRVARVRYAAEDRVPASVLKAAAETGFYIARGPVLMEGRVELLHYLRPQSISDSYHRYGNLGDRATDFMEI